VKWFDANGTDVDAYPNRAFRGGVYAINVPEDYGPEDAGDRDGGPLEDANEDALDKWAER
jgi:hypothetical protein